MQLSSFAVALRTMHRARQSFRMLSALAAGALPLASQPALQRAHDLSNAEADSQLQQNGHASFAWLRLFRDALAITPVFAANGADIRVLEGPTAFYNQLRKSIQSAQDRIMLASLYLGTGEQERELVDDIHNALSRPGSRVKVHIMLDCLRATRGKPSSVDLLAPLVRDFPNRCSISLYHTPALSGLWKAYLPERFNETLGVGHIKAYLVDNDIILSGANLSDSYFTDRLDRYIMFYSSPITEYFSDLIQMLRPLCFSYDPTLSNSTSLIPPEITNVDLTKHPRIFMKQATPTVHAFLQKWQHRTSKLRNALLDESAISSPLFQNEELISQVAPSIGKNDGNAPRCSSTPDTILAISLQMRHYDVDQDEQVTVRMLEAVGKDAEGRLHITSGYFNFTQRYENLILKSKAPVEIIAASPKANGFFGSKGISRHLPAAYTWIEKKFLRKVKRAGRQDDIQIKEYERPGWTYHAKGLWYFLPHESDPSVTTIGSPNYGHRSVERDIEAQVFIFTENRELKKDIRKGLEQLRQYTKPITLDTLKTDDRNVHPGVAISARIVRGLL